jgi:hypothetical protein
MASVNQDGSLTGIFGQRYAAPGLHLSISGSCGGPVTVDVSHATPNTEVGVVRAANNNGFVKGGTLCNGAAFEIGEPFLLPPVWLRVDASGTGSTNINLPANRCWVQGLGIPNCDLTNAVQVP